MILSNFLRFLVNARNQYRRKAAFKYIQQRIDFNELFETDRFDFNNFKEKITYFLMQMETEKYKPKYLYSEKCSKPTLYASTYACMTLGLLGNLKKMPNKSKAEWADYFNSFQSEKDGFFYDNNVLNSAFMDSDWWGRRHLALHMVSAYTALGCRPQYKFSFLEEFYDANAIKLWLDYYNWTDASLGNGDVDNKIMNIGCLLQYQRDCWNDEKASAAVSYLKSYLLSKINDAGMWGGFNADKPAELSRMVQFAYHLYSIFFYDKEFEFNFEKVVTLVLKTQNEFGGYGIHPNSSACEDIDSIDILIRFAPYLPERKADIDLSLRRAFKWIMINQMNDGGLVFKIGEPMAYGHKPEMSSNINQSAMFPTWFRTLALAYITRYFGMEYFQIDSSPGYQQ